MQHRSELQQQLMLINEQVRDGRQDTICKLAQTVRLADSACKLCTVVDLTCKSLVLASPLRPKQLITPWDGC